MTKQEYFEQACQLNKRINHDIQDMAAQAPAAENLEKLAHMQEKINREIDTLVDLKDQIREVISNLPNQEEQTALCCYYIWNQSLEQIAEQQEVNPGTIRRWHDAAMLHVVLPAEPIRI